MTKTKSGFPPKEIERRAFQEIELRAEAEGPPRIVGYAAVFNELSEDLGGFREKIAPGAFSKSLGEDIRALYNHDSNIVLGRTKSRTLSVAEDQRGLKVEISPRDTGMGLEVIEAMKRGDVDQMSFGFRMVNDHWEELDGEIVRTLLEVKLFDVSVVTFPAYPQTEAAVRSLELWKETSASDLPDYDHLRRRITAAEL